MRALLVLALALVLAGCARFPNGTGVPRYTRLTFRFTVDGLVGDDNNYVYAVAIRPFFKTDRDGSGNPLVSADGTPLNNDAYGPVPVLSYNNGSRNLNGIVAGRPTRIVLYTPGGSANRYLVYKFGPTGDPSDPIQSFYELNGDILTNSGLDPKNPLPGNSNTFGFTIDPTNLVDDPFLAQQVAGIQFNVIATNKALRFPGDENHRGIDAIGNQKDIGTLNNYFAATLLTSKTYADDRSTVPEPTGDVYGVGQPAIDITSWSLDVRLP